MKLYVLTMIKEPQTSSDLGYMGNRKKEVIGIYTDTVQPRRYALMKLWDFNPKAEPSEGDSTGNTKNHYLCVMNEDRTYELWFNITEIESDTVLPKYTLSF